MKKRITLALIFTAWIFSASLFAFDWPLREGRLMANFGANNDGVPLVGNIFAAYGSVFPVEVGELIFVHEPGNPASRFPSPLGSWMALDHGGDMIGLYSRYAERGDIPVPTIMETTTILASAGRSGWSEQDGLFFAFFDRRERRWVNPAIVIQGNVSRAEDTILPVIRAVELRNVAGTSFNPAIVQWLPQGQYTLYVDAWDNLEPGGEAVAPHRIIVSLNGVETAVLSFETLVSRRGQRMAFRGGMVPAVEVHNERGFGMGELRLTRGQAVLVIEVQDITGNARFVTYRLTID